MQYAASKYNVLFTTTEKAYILYKWYHMFYRKTCVDNLYTYIQPSKKVHNKINTAEIS